jgi:hypothetical protein
MARLAWLGVSVRGSPARSATSDAPRGQTLSIKRRIVYRHMMKRPRMSPGAVSFFVIRPVRFRG